MNISGVGEKNLHVLILGYVKEAETIFDENDDCCYDPNPENIPLGSGGFIDPIKYFNKTSMIYI